jgi:hypothetical protein
MTSVVGTFNAMGNYLLPMVIMKGTQIKPDWCIGAAA